MPRCFPGHFFIFKQSVLMQIFPSLMNQDLDQIKNTIRLLGPYCAGFHIDIMDGKFVKNSTGSVALCNAITRMTRKQLWVHLMVEEPIKTIELLKLHRGDIVTFHYESQGDYQTIIEALEHKNVRPSLALSPKTPISALTNPIHVIDHVTIMSVEPGKSGQKFIPNTIKKLERLNAFRAAHECTLTIAVDGGINKSNITKLDALGVNQVAISSGIFSSSDPVAALQELNKISLQD